MSKSNIIQLSEFDITQKIIESLSNVCTRAVLFSIKNESKDATQIADELKRSEEHTSELQSQAYLVCRLLLEKKKKTI